MSHRVSFVGLLAGAVLLSSCSSVKERAAADGGHRAAQPRSSASPVPGPSPSPTGPDDPGQRLPLGRVLLTGSGGHPQGVEVEVAATNASRSRGLMWRKELPEGKGMLFVFPSEQRQSFWMKNTLLPLDMVFIDSRMQVVGIVSRAEPGSLAPRGVQVPSRYVLEVPGGWAEAHGVTVGAKVELHGLGLIPVE